MMIHSSIDEAGEERALLLLLAREACFCVARRMYVCTVHTVSLGLHTVRTGMYVLYVRHGTQVSTGTYGAFFHVTRDGKSGIQTNLSKRLRREQTSERDQDASDEM
jgi:hypothetical protein